MVEPTGLSQLVLLTSLPLAALPWWAVALAYVTPVLLAGFFFTVQNGWDKATVAIVCAIVVLGVGALFWIGLLPMWYLVGWTLVVLVPSLCVAVLSVVSRKDNQCSG